MIKEMLGAKLEEGTNSAWPTDPILIGKGDDDDDESS